MKKSTVLGVALLAMIFTAAGCDSGNSVDGSLPDIPEPIDPRNFADLVDNTYWPVVTGTTFSYAWEANDGAQMTQEVEVLLEKRDVDGVEATVVFDQVFKESALVRETHAWYAQDDDGNVWILGKESYDVVEFDKRLDPASFESGVGGALAGVFMPAEPVVGDYFYMEYYKGRAQDVAEIVSLGETVNVPGGVFKECVRVRETTPLDLAVQKYRYYCPGVGLVLTIDVAEGNLREELVNWGGL